MAAFTGIRVLILGLAREGESLARYFAAAGAHVTVTDAAPEERLAGRVAALPLQARRALGGTFPELVEEADVLYVSPGVPEDNGVYTSARAAGLPIRSMTTLFFELCPAPILGVTGSSGKTTTTGLIGHILRTAGRDVVVGGNIGDPMLDLLPSINPSTTVVLELSSFQLQLLERSPRIAVVTNISPNHLDRHRTMESYIDAKRRIVQFQGQDEHAVLNWDDAEVRGFAGSTCADVHGFSLKQDGLSTHVRGGAALVGDYIGVVRGSGFVPVMPVSDIPLLGRHNVANGLAATAATDILDVSADVMARAIRSYRAPAHRLQTVARLGGVLYVDDSIATSPARASVALEAIDAPILLIAGGRDKNLPWDEFARLAVRKVEALFLIGEAASLIDEAMQEALSHTEDPTLRLRRTSIYRCSSLDDAVRRASAAARPGDVVLLSPGCTSYDMFTNFEERGQCFARVVGDLHAA